MIPTIIFHGNYILCQQKAAGKRPCPPKESHSQAFSKENRTAAGWLSGESRSTGAEGERKRRFLNLSGKRTVNEYSDSRYLICFLCMAISMYRLQAALSPVYLYQVHRSFVLLWAFLFFRRGIMELITNIVNSVNTFLWDYALLILLLGSGVFFTFMLRFIQIRKFGAGMKALFGNFSLHGKSGEN